MLPSPPVSRAVLCFYPWVVILLETQLWEFTCMHSIKHSVIKREILFILSNSGMDLVRIIFYTITLTASYRDYVFYNLHFTSQGANALFSTLLQHDNDFGHFPLAAAAGWVLNAAVQCPISINNKANVCGWKLGFITGYCLFMTGFSPNLWCLQLVILC